MRDLIVAEFISLDGVIQAPGGADEDTDGGFTQGGWTMPYWHEDIGAHFFEAMSRADALLLGRRTWQIHSVFDAMSGDAFFDTINGMHKFVVSNTLESTAAWRNSTVIRGDALAAIRELKQQEGRSIVLDGSSVLNRLLAEHDLVDEYILHVYPVVLGGGKRLFPEGHRLNLQLVESTALPTGVMYTRYRRDPALMV